MMKRNTTKRPAQIASLVIALLLMITAVQLPVFANAGETQSDRLQAGTALDDILDDGAYSEDKEPRQVNVHMGDDPSTQVNFTYSTIEEAQSQVVITKDGEVVLTETGSTVIGQAGKYIHGIPVSGLEPYTDYEYTVGYGENTYSGSFRTAPAKGSTDTIKFAYLADTQVSNATNAKALGATLHEVNNMDDIDFVYIAGDVTDTATSETQWEQLFYNDGLYPNGGQDMFGNNLLAVTQGNHDNNVMYNHINAPAQMGNIVYAFDYGPLTMIMLNLETARSDATARDAQAEFLREAVADAQARGQWTAVGFHKSLVTGASHIVDSDVVSARQYWIPIFAELDVDMVLQGHDHVYSRGFADETGYAAEKTVLEDGTIIAPSNAPLYMIGGHAGGLKWYSKISYTPAANDPIAPDYSFLDVNSADTREDGTPGSDVLKEQVIVEMEVSETELTVNTWMFKYDTDLDEITTEKYLFDSFVVRRTNESSNGTIYLETDAHLVKDGDYFEVNAGFVTETESNTAILDFTYDTEVFEYKGFVGGEKVTMIDEVTSETGATLIVMIEDYKALALGTLTLSAKEDADLKNGDHSIGLNVEYVERDENGDKEIKDSYTSISFTSGNSGGGGSGENGEYTLIDLSDVIDMFGADSSDPNWDEYRFYDFNNNGVIDIYDISYIAKQIK